MTREEFETLVGEALGRLPGMFAEALENVGIVVEEYPSEEIVKKMRLRSKRDLLGLYQGTPLTMRGTSYGMMPTVPDTISLYQKNIEDQAGPRGDIPALVQSVLIHEIAHYFGMDEDQVRAAGY